MCNVTTTRTSLQTEMNWIGFTMSVETKKTEVVTTETTEVVTKFDLPSSVKDEDARFIAEHGKLTDKGAGPTITLTQKQLDAFFDRKGVTKEDQARVFKGYDDFVQAAYVVGGHLAKDLIAKAKTDGVDPAGEKATVTAQSKFFRPTVSVAATRVNTDPRNRDNKTVVHGHGSVRFSYSGEIKEEVVNEISSMIRKAIG